MPQDYRRFNGPEDSVPYHRYTKDFMKKPEVLYEELIDANSLRKDGRALDESRSMCMFFARTDMVSQAKGSAYVEMKKTKVVCSVFDPREIPHHCEFSTQGKLYCEVKYAPFSCSNKRRAPPPDAEEKSLSVAVKAALDPAVCRHMFPNFQIDIFIYILEQDGSCLSAAINAAGLALANAAVPMYDVICSSTLAVLDDKILIDPTEAEEALALTIKHDTSNYGLITISTLLQMKQVTDVRLIGALSMETMIKSVDMLEKQCQKILPNLQRVLVAHVVDGQKEYMRLVEETKQREDMLKEKMKEWEKLLKEQ